MSFFTPADAAYIKRSVRKIIQLSARGGISITSSHVVDISERDAELARLEAFIDGCTLEGRKGSE